ncbi:MAG: hydroxymethylbilane synthase [Bacteroidia bacterium]|nr:hydroxymethylbilane synthase [Bacteroidia bacterium]
MIIGTRGSRLALWQARVTKKLLEKEGIDSDLKIIKTKGDKIQNLSFDKIEGKGFFTKELEDHLLEESIDIAVHSLKDLPTTQPEGLVLGAVLERADPADWLIIRKSCVDNTQELSLKANPVIGTSSARRKAQILHFKPDAIIKDIRGNVPTRLKKLADGDFEAIILAAAGLSRLEIDLGDFFVIKFNPREFIPAPGQGVIAIQTRKNSLSLRRLLKKIHCNDVSQCTNVERQVLRLFDGGCHLPLGVHCRRDQHGNYHTHAAYAISINSPVEFVQISSSTSAGLAHQLFKRFQVT